MRKGKFDLEDFADQLAQVEKIGGLGGIMGMLPGIAKMKDQIASANLDDRIIKRQRAIILSMTPPGAAQSRHSQGLAQEAHRGGLRHQGRGRQPAAEAASQMADMMKADGRRQARADGQDGLDVRPWRRHAGWHARRHADAERRTSSRPCRSRWAPARRRHAERAGESAEPCRRAFGGKPPAGSRRSAGSWRHQTVRAWAAADCPVSAAHARHAGEEEMRIAATIRTRR